MSKLTKKTYVIAMVLALIGFSIAFINPVSKAHAAGLTLVVNSTLDTTDAVPGDNACDDGSGNCTLRAAIEEANFDATLDTINFAITGTADFTVNSQDGYQIVLANELPQVITPITINGLSQPNSSCPSSRTLLIEVDGTAPSYVNGILSFEAGSDGSTVQGIAFANFAGNAIEVDQSDDTVISCNNIGVRANGTTAAGGPAGVSMSASDGIEFSNNIAGNASVGWVIFATGVINASYDSNYIGTNPASADFGGALDGVSHANGDNATFTNNVVGFNSNIGILLNNSDNSDFYSNYIGINEALDTAIGNGGDGIAIQNSAAVDVGDVLTPNYVFNNSFSQPNYGGITTYESSDVSIRGNRVAGNGNVQIILSFNTTDSQATANLVGSTANPSIPIGISETTGVGMLFAGANDNIFGGTDPSDANTIAGVSGAGILISDLEVTAIPTTAPASGNIVLGNSIYDIDPVTLTQYGGTQDFDMGIDFIHAIDSSVGPDFIPDSYTGSGPTLNDVGDVDGGANELLNFPTLTSSTQSGTDLDIVFDLTAVGSPSGEYRVEFYVSDVPTSSGYGPGQTFIGSVNTASGTGLEASITLAPGLDITGKTISTTATPINSGATFGFDGTSEFGNQTVVVLGSSALNSSGGNGGSSTTGASGTLANTGSGSSGLSFSFVLLLLGIIFVGASKFKLCKQA